MKRSLCQMTRGIGFVSVAVVEYKHEAPASVSFAPFSRLRVVLVFAILGLAALTEPVRGDEIPDVASLRISPAELRLGGANRQRQVLITAETKSGRVIDVTRRCEIAVADPGVASAVKGLLRGKGDGRTELSIRYGEIVLRVPVIVAGFDSYPPVNFANDVVPVFSKLGCNSGSCHGKASGQNGFKLSLFGFDPVADFAALVKEARGRRIFPADPSHSTLLAKATGRVAHGGGRRMEAGSLDHDILTQWIRQGAPWGDERAPRLVSIAVEPELRVMDMQSAQQILVTATYSDGSTRDVTQAASYASNATVIADVDQNGLMNTGKIPGEAAMTVGYMGQMAAVRVLIPRPGAPDPYPRVPVHNRIDEFVWAKLQKLGILPSELSDDATFLRRVFIDTIGTLPKPAEVREFLADRDPGKRSRVIDQVLARGEFADYWALKWADILLLDREKLGERGAYEFHGWLRDQFARNRPYNEWVHELLTATGDSGSYGPVNFYRALEAPEDVGKAVSQAFLGVRIDCAQCHHHPFEKWGQSDFYGMAGFFAGIEKKSLRAGRDLVYHAGYRETKHPLTGEPVPTRPLGGEVPQNLKNGDPRAHLADWVTGDKNPWFARLAASRLWKHYLGRGLTEPEDDFRSTNPATNEPLLVFLSDQVIANRYDLKAVMRLIMNSRTYQLSSVPNETNAADEQNFSHFLVKRLSAEALLDAISQVTGSPESFAGMPGGTRAIELWDNRMPSYFLETFGRSERKSPCECGKSNEPTMAQALHLMNAPEIDKKISSPSGRVAKLLAAKMPRDRIIKELTLAALGRPPREKERTVAAKLFSQESEQQAAEDFLWTLLNSYDFLFVR